MTETELKLVEKITRAKLKLEKAKQPHHHACHAEDDTGFPARCNCGADQFNIIVDDVLKELKLP